MKQAVKAHILCSKALLSHELDLLPHRMASTHDSCLWKVLSASQYQSKFILLQTKLPQDRALTMQGKEVKTWIWLEGACVNTSPYLCMSQTL